MKQISSYNRILRTELEAVILAKAETDPSVPWKTDFLRRLLPFAATGKLLRGSLVCFSYAAFSGRQPAGAVIEAAAALEIAHSGLLIHDDIMDGDTLRRGRPSMHRQYQDLAIEEKLADAGHFGDSMAMCGGDAALFMAFELLGSIDVEPGTRTKIMRLFMDQFILTCAGQMQDLYFESRSDLPGKEAIYKLMETKTAAYTLSLPLAMGAILAGAPSAAIRRLQAIGVSAGTIFQIRDDELGVMGDSGETGKPVGSDIKEGKKTLLYHYLQERSGAREREKLRTIFGNPDAGTEDIGYVKRLVKTHGIQKLLNNEINRLERQALHDIEGLELPEKAKKELAELVNFCGERRA
jgi:geranylgeranyl diphosphate synthase type I